MKLVWLSLVLAATCAQQATLQDRPRTFCGRNLAAARLLYCYGTEEFIRKKSLRSPFFDALSSVKSEVPSLWFKAYLQARSLVSSRFKRETGLADECCLKPCYISELQNYC